MALLNIIGTVRRKDEESDLQKIAMAFNIAQSALGTALAVPKFLQDRQAAKQETALKRDQLASQQAANAREVASTKGLLGKTFRPIEPGETADVTFDETFGGPSKLRVDPSKELSEIQKLAVIDLFKDTIQTDAKDPQARPITVGGSTFYLKPPQVKKEPIDFTPAETQIDKSFGKEYSDYIVAGGFADVQKNLKQLKDVKKILGQENVTGPLLGLVPKIARDVAFPQSAGVQDTVEEVVQRNLRLVLGAQFTEKEGTRLIERSYNPRLSEKENAKRIDRLTEQIERAAKAKDNAAKYYEKHGTLKGYQGSTNFRAFFPDLDETAPSTDEENNF